MLLYVGVQAISKEPSDIINTDRVMLCFLPVLSAIRPKSHPPNGRIRKPNANMPAVFSSCAVSSPFGKKEPEK